MSEIDANTIEAIKVPVHNSSYFVDTHGAHVWTMIKGNAEHGGRAHKNKHLQMPIVWARGAHVMSACGLWLDSAPHHRRQHTCHPHSPRIP